MSDADTFVWTSRAVRSLFGAYEERRHLFADPKTKKKSLWTEILEEMASKGYCNLTENQLDRKMRNLKQNYKTIKKNIKETGRNRITWEFFGLCESLFGGEPSIDDTLTLSSFDDTAGSDKFVWTSRAVRSLVTLYGKKRHEFADPKITNKPLWNEIIEEMACEGYKNLTEKQLDRKMRNLKHTYKKIKANNNEAGHGRITWKFFDLFEDLFGGDHSVSESATVPSFDDNSLESVEYKDFEYLNCESADETSKSEVAEDRDRNASKKRKVESPQNLHRKNKRRHEADDPYVVVLSKISTALERANEINQQRNTLLGQLIQIEKEKLKQSAANHN